MSLLFTLSNLGNTTPVNPQAPVQRETKGLREEELRLASRAIVSIIPCLRIFYPPYRRGEGEIGHYDQLADVIINLQVPTHTHRWFRLPSPVLVAGSCDCSCLHHDISIMIALP